MPTFSYLCTNFLLMALTGEQVKWCMYNFYNRENDKLKELIDSCLLWWIQDRSKLNVTSINSYIDKQNNE